MCVVDCVGAAVVGVVVEVVVEGVVEVVVEVVAEEGAAGAAVEEVGAEAEQGGGGVAEDGVGADCCGGRGAGGGEEGAANDFVHSGIAVSRARMALFPGYAAPAPPCWRRPWPVGFA